LIVAVIVALILGMIYFAIPAMVQIADVWETTRNSGKSGVESSTLNIPLDVPRLDAFAGKATSNANVTISGRAQAGLTIQLKVNGKDLSPVVADNNGTFTFNDVKLSEGVNTFKAWAQDSKGRKSEESPEMQLVMDTKAPRVQINEPYDGQTFGGAQQLNVTVKGKADEATQVYVNESWAMMKADGTFETRLQLQPGQNTITVYAKDDAENKSPEVVRRVNYNP
jgi:hypothetical protein